MASATWSHHISILVKRYWIIVLIAAIGLPAGGARAIEFNFDPGADLQAMLNGSTAEQDRANEILACFEFAGSVWSARLGDSITVNIDVDYSPLGSNVLGSTDSHTLSKTYSQVYTGLNTDVATYDDFIATSHLQTGASLDLLTNDTSQAGFAEVIRDNDGSSNNVNIDINRANAKALGLLSANHPSADANIVFSSDMSWDFDRTNGVSSGTYDLVGVAIHEIGHVLGFVSGVDVVDMCAQPDGPQSPLDLQNYRVFSVHDLYRYSSASLAEANQPATGAVLDLSVSNDAYFSIDAGATSIGTLCTGRYNGDGQQASHWKDNQGLGVMDPTLGWGVLANLTANDLLAMDVIGYDRLACTWGDFNDDGVVDAADIDALLAAVNAGSTDWTFDVNFNNYVTEADRDVLIHDLLGTEYGDADLDGDVDLDDFVLLKTYFGTGDSWAQADFDGNGTVDLMDFVTLKTYFGSKAVPEPTTLTLLALAGATMLRRQR